MIGFGALVSFIGLWALVVAASGIQMGVRGPATRPYSTAPIGWAGGAVLAIGLVILARGLIERRRRNAARDAARTERRSRPTPP